MDFANGSDAPLGAPVWRHLIFDVHACVRASSGDFATFASNIPTVFFKVLKT